MIESVSMAGVASYGKIAEVLSDLSRFNFIFGSNGTGKTTITRVIADEASFPTCRVTWKRGTKMQVMAYNLDFVEKNFNQSSELRGVFTLGEKNIGTLTKIATAKADLDVLGKNIEELNVGLQGEDGAGGKLGQLAALERELKEKCWAQKQEHDGVFSGAFEGYRSNAEKFKVKVLEEWDSNSGSLTSYEDLGKKAETVFGATPVLETPIMSVDTARVLGHESNTVMKRRIIGKEDVDIAGMIRRLSNSDWVREGREYFEANDKMCPFCQQRTSDGFATSLNEYFDETFERNSRAIAELESDYKSDCGRLQRQIETILASPPKFLETEKLSGEKVLLDSKITVNIQRIATKRKEPSQSVELESLSSILGAIEAHLSAANAAISEFNMTVANLAEERRILTSQVWKYLIEVDLKGDLTDYKTKRADLIKAIEAMKDRIMRATNERSRKEAELRTLERQTTSIQPTIEEINSLLLSFGFRSFSLSKADNGTCYRLTRSDGTDAKETLSEGEKSFVTFLYFYYLLKGSESESGVTTDRVVVFDDPVSSLDSDILFIVASLIKGLFEEVRGKTGHIKQIFVLTHNVYFHREVTFNPKRSNRSLAEETFWTVHKADLVSVLEKHLSNPVKTSYELMWAEVRKPRRSIHTIQNTLRRILENYFKVLGGVDPDQICAMFDGKERLICKSLFLWVNAGSHYTDDDLYLSVTDSSVNAYLEVFRLIFEKSHQLAHYKMMMGGSIRRRHTKPSEGMASMS